MLIDVYSGESYGELVLLISSIWRFFWLFLGFSGSNLAFMCFISEFACLAGEAG